jgi:VCBS repeat-containing protein
MSATLSFAAASISVLEGQAGTTLATFTVLRVGNLSATASVDWAVSFGTASLSDFVGGMIPSGVVTFLPGEGSKVITVPIAGDTLLEGSESFSIQLTSPLGARLEPVVQSGMMNSFIFYTDLTRATANIVNDDGAILGVTSAQGYEGTSSNGSVDFTVTRSGDTSIAASATWAISLPASGGGLFGPPVASGTTSPIDFAGGILPSGTITFAPGETSRVISIATLADAVAEGAEPFTLTLSNPSAGATIATTSATGTIQEDDGPLRLTLTGFGSLYREGQTGGTAVSFTVTRTGDPSVAVSADWAVSPETTGAAVSGADFLGGALPSGTVSFAPGEMSRTISFDIAGDGDVEPAEGFRIALSNPSGGAQLTSPIGPYFIDNDDGAIFSLRTTDLATPDSGAALGRFAEGQAGSNFAHFEVLRGRDLQGTVSVEWEVFLRPSIFGFMSFVPGDTATAADFAGGILPRGTLTFAPGETSKLIQVPIAGDTEVESNETYSLRIINPSAGSSLSGTTSGVAMIANDDVAATLTVGSLPSITEGNAGTTPVTVTITRSGNTAIAASANWTVLGPDGQDFAGGLRPSGTVSFASGETQQTISFSIAGDTLVEADETYSIDLTELSVGAVEGLSLSGTILSDDGTFLSFGGSVSQAEGNSGSTPFVFTVLRSGDTSGVTTVNWAVGGVVGTWFFTPPSASGNDFVGGAMPSGTLSFAAGETSRTITVNVAGDTTVESSEEFRVILSAPSAGTFLRSGTALGTITNDDVAAPSDTVLSFGLGQSNVFTEGQSGNTPVSLTVTRSGDLSRTSTATWTVSGPDTIAPASASDFMGGAFPTGTVSFAPGEASQTISLSLAGDTLIEPNERFTVLLSAPSAGTTLDSLYASVTGTITNDDGALLSLAPFLSQAEGSAGGTAFAFTVTRGGDLGIAASASWMVSGTNTGGGSASASDFVGDSLPGGVVSFAAGETSKTITLMVKSDSLLESNETFLVTLLEPSSGAFVAAPSSSATIMNDDGALIALGTSPTQITEGDAGGTPVSLTVNRTGDTSVAASANWAVSGVNASGSDFVGGVLPSGVVSFAAGETSKTITFQVAGDTAVEGNEVFTVSLSGFSAGASQGFGSAGSFTIVNDDGTILTLGTSAPSLAEGNAGNTSFAFTVTRTGDTSTTVSASWSVAGNGAQPADAADFVGGVLPSGTVNFLAGETSKTIVVDVVGDTVSELNEEFTLTLSNPSVGAALGTATAARIILNDDIVAPVLAIAPLAADQAEGNAGPTAFTFTVTRTGDTSGASSANWAVTGNGATAADFVGNALPSGTVNFAAGEASQVITVNVAGDTAIEGHEGFTITLSAPNGATLGTAAATGTIRNDDAALSARLKAQRSIEVTAGGVEDTILNLDIAESASGGFLLTWEVWDRASATGPILAQTGFRQSLDAAGVPIGPAQTLFNVTAGAFSGGVGGHPNASPGADGGTILAWAPLAVVPHTLPSGPSTLARSGDKILVQRLDVAGNLLGVTEVTAGGVEDTVLNLDVAAAANGGFLLTWEIWDRASATGPILAQTGFRQSFDAAGVATGAAQTLFNVTAGAFTSTVAANPNAIASADGGTILAWAPLAVVPHTLPSGPSTLARSGDKILVQRLDAAGNLLGVTEVTAGGIEDTVLNLDVAAAANGGFLLTWEIWDRASATGPILAQTGFRQSFDAAGVATGTAQTLFNVTAGSFASGVGGNPSVGLGAEGGSILAWAPLAVVPFTSPFGPSTQTRSGDKILVQAEFLTSSASIQEGNGASTPVTFSAWREGDVSAAGSVRWSVVGAGANPANAFDFAGSLLPSGTLNFAAGQSIQDFTIFLGADTQIELDEQFTIAFSDPSSGLTITGTAPVVTILNDDFPVPTLLIAALDADKAEGHVGASAFTFTVTRTGHAGGASTANWAITGNGATAADFVGNALPSGTVSFAAGQATQTITVNVAGDSAHEAHEGFTITLSAPTDATLGTATATGTIRNDDALLSVSGGAPLAEGNTGTTAFAFTVTRTGDASTAVSADWAITGSGAQPANAADFIGGTLPSGVINFFAGETTKTITVDVIGDTVSELHEEFTLTLSNPSVGAALGTATAARIILNDDIVAPVLAIAPLAADQAEGNAGPTAFTFTVTRTGDLSGASSANWAVTGNGANAADFTGAVLPSGTVSFLAGETSQTITVNVAGDTTTEPNEGFTVTLSAPSGATLGTASATGTIRNDDVSLFSIAALAADRSEGNSGPTAFTFTVSREGNTNIAVGLAFTVTASGADPAGGIDFTAGVLPTGTLTFAVGEASRTLTVNILGDALFEPDEGFTVTLSSANPAAVFSTASAQGIIRNDDPRTITGTAGPDTLTGTAANELLLGLGDNDVLDGGAGTDTLDGGAGNDTLFASLGNDSIIGGAGVDTLVFGPGFAGVDLGLVLGGVPVINLADGPMAFSGIENFVANSGNDQLFGDAAANGLNGGAGNDLLYGGAGNDSLTGGLGVDRFEVDTGTDTVTDLGLGGADVLLVFGGATANVTVAAAWTATAASNVSGIANLTANGLNVDLSAAAPGLGLWNLTNAGNATGVRFTGSVNADALTGGEGNDTLLGGASGDTLSGNGGTDSLSGGTGNDSLNGGADNDTLLGEADEDSLTGGAGDDRMTGGAGTDRFAVDAGTDTITDLGLGGADVLVVWAGATANATLAGNWTFTLGSNNGGTANITAAGFNADLGQAAGSAGWAVSNLGTNRAVSLTGSARNDTLTGGNGNDTLTGGGANDSLLGDAGSDSLTGGTGNDTMTGGAAVDRFVVDAGTDSITDLAAGGNDVLVVLAGATANATLGGNWTASSNVSNAGVANLTAAGFNVNLTATTGFGTWSVTQAGQAGAVVFAGSVQGDRLTGGLGADSLAGNAGDDTLTGGDGADTLNGGAGIDSLVGGLGNDSLTGGAELDRFLVEAGTDSITDLGFGGTDALIIQAGAAAVATIGGHWTASGGSSNAGSASLFAAGFDVNVASVGGASGWVLSNAGQSRGVSLVGSGNADSVTGGSGADTLRGQGGADSLSGGGGNDQLFGGAGNDTMTGGAGIDRFTVDAGTDVITDLAAGGVDVVIVSAGATLQATLAADWVATAASSNAGVANLSTAGFDVNLGAAAGSLGWNVSASTADAVMLTGSRRADVLTGGAGADTLIGGAGNDTLVGGGGADRLMGGADHDRLAVADGAFHSVDGGTGTDTLALMASGLTLELTGSLTPRVTSIERFDLTGFGDNTLLIDRLALLSATELRTAGQVSIAVDGNAGDTLRFAELGWSLSGNVTEGGVTYARWQASAGDAELRVAAAVTVVPFNAPASIGGTSTGAVAEDGTLTASGALTVTDPDLGQAVFAAPASLAGTYGSFSFDATSGAWGYALNNAAANVQALATGETVTDTLTVTSLDGTATQAITLSIAGQDEPVLLERVDLSTLTAAQGFIIQGDVAGDQAGRSVSTAGDVNGDGFADLIVGAPQGQDGGLDAGEAYVVFGGAGSFGTAVTMPGVTRQVVDLTTLTAAQGFIIQGDKGPDWAGKSVSTAGDVNGDGFADLIIGAYQAQGGSSMSGEAYVVFGSAAGFGTAVTLSGVTRQVLDLTNLSASQGFIIQGDAYLDRAGYSVSTAGDVNGDGFADLLLGVPYNEDGGGYAGAAYVLFGGAAGFGTAMTVSGITRQVLDLTNLSAAQGFIIQGDAAGDRAGSSVGTAGDVNGDGFADLIVGAHFGDDGGAEAGEAYVLFGGAGGFGTAIGGRQVIDLTTLTAAQGFIIQGDAAVDRAGSSVGTAGDVNGDGFADLIVGAPYGNDGGARAGEAYVLFGGAGGFGTAIGGRQVIDLTTLTAAQGFIIQGDAISDWAGFSASSAGDVNGDGFADLVVGAPMSDDGTLDAGAAYVLFGGAAGFGTAVGGRQVLDLTLLTAAQGFVIQGDRGRDLAGGSVSTAGDVNGDGFADLIVGARGGDDGGDYAGEAYVLFGGALGGNSTPVTTNGTVAAEILIGALGNDSLLGGGGADVLRGGAGNDRLGVADSAFRSIDGGLGTDTLALTGSGQTLDLTLIGAARITSIERFDLTGTGNNTLVLRADDVFALSGTSDPAWTFSTLPAALVVDGNAGDTLDLWDFDPDGAGPALNRAWVKVLEDVTLSGAAGGAYDVWELQAGTARLAAIAAHNDLNIL